MPISSYHEFSKKKNQDVQNIGSLKDIKFLRKAAVSTAFCTEDTK